MDSDDLKPLIFIEPLSETLQKLKDVISETAAEDGIEIFECSDLNEANQLIPTIGQSICIMSNPKMCAMMLKANRRAVKVSQSKVILLSNKQIPRNTLDKFMKIGLTECVVEPVAPKTLLYKVKLFLRSIASKNEKGKMNSLMDKETARNKAIEEVQAGTKREKSKQEEIKEQILTQKKMAEEIKMENYSKQNKGHEPEDDLGGFYKGKSKKKLNMLEVEEEDKKESGYQEEAIDTHYKGKNSKKLDLMDIDEPAAKKEEILEEEELAEMKKKLAFQLEDDLKKDKQKNVEELEEEFLEMQKKLKLELEEDPEEQKKSQGNEQEDLGGHMKGKINKGLHLIDEEDQDYIDKEEIEEEEIEAKKKVQLQIDEVAEEKEDYIDHQEEEDIYAKKSGVKLEIEEVYEEDRTKDFIEEEEEEIQKDPKIKLEIEEDSTESERKKQKADEIDKYMRSAKAKKGLQLEDGPEDDIKNESLEEEEEKERDKKIKLDIEDDNNKNDKDFQDGLEEESEEYTRKKNIKLEMVDDTNSKDKTQEEQVEDEDDSFGQKKVKLHLEEDGDMRREKGASLDEKEMNRRRDSHWQEEEKGGMGNRANARAEKIKTHYSSKESIKHNDQNWDNMWEKKEKEEEAQAKTKKDGGELIIEKEDLGEQTIDYKRLKEEFESMDYGSVRKKKKYGVSSEPALKIVEVTKTLFHDDGSEEEIIFQEVIEDEEATTVNVYEPEPNGLDTAVEILNLYMLSETQIGDITKFIAKKIHDRFKGKTSFFFFDQSKGSYIEEYCGHIELEIGPAPTPMSPRERDNYSRSEIREIEKEIELEIKTYNEEKETFQKDWDFLREGKIADWQNAKLPIWSDNTFQTEANEFTYPIYEGVDPLGYAIVSFEQVFKEEDAKTLEIILESARGIYLEKVHQLRGENQNYGEEKKKVEKKKKGLLGGLFGKKAG